jgi:hypothetical protein
MNSKRLRPLGYGLLASSAALAAAVDAAPGEGREQVVRSAAGYSAERAPDTLRDLATFEETRIAREERVTRAKGSASASSTAADYQADHWIYDANTEIFFDADNDGYFRYLRVSFDVDTYYTHAWVYARLYLSADGELWEMYYETDDFLIEGSVPDDEYEVETELVVNYPTGQYDVLIEIYDADTGLFVEEFGPAQSSAFALLPLEDMSYDNVVPPPVIIVDEGGGGAFSWLGLLLLGAAAAARALRHGSENLHS